MTETNQLLNFNHARTEEQINLMKKIKEDKVCPFCWDNFEKYHPKPVIKKGSWWLITKNAFPYTGTKNHFLLIYRHHISKICQITPQASIELVILLSWIEQNFDVEGGGVFMRFGETKQTGSSVEHLHVQLIQGNSQESSLASPIKVKLGYSE
ncbi:MAG: hypothetical protein U9P50_01460 [Patescibacteria group bacterium]|nr:hypothetical protein [Patescibacteria group bacterium]